MKEPKYELVSISCVHEVKVPGIQGSTLQVGPARYPHVTFTESPDGSWRMTAGGSSIRIPRHNVKHVEELVR